MFVVFEGIDGSGKTTVSNRVAGELRSRGIEVQHIREGGEFASALVTRMREFAKDPRNLAMEPMTEFLLYVARDAQLLAECVGPALSDGGLVFADRYLYSYEVLGHHGRGLEVERVRPVLDAVSGGLWPDLVVLLDVDPHVARARRKVRKLERKARGESGPGSRKGLGGVGMQHRLRDGYLELAENDPKRWLVIDNAHSALDEIVNEVAEAISSLYEGAPAGKVVAATEIGRRPRPAAASPSLEDGRRAFYDVIADRAAVEPPVAAYFLAGLDDPDAHAWRDRLADDAPDAVAYGLRGLDDPPAWAMRERLAEAAPHFVARSLDRLTGERADALRERFAATEPIAVLSTLRGDDGGVAWRLRDRLVAELPDAVLRSTEGLASDRAWQAREQALARHGERLLRADPTAASPLAGSLGGLDDDRAWELRELLFDSAPSEVLRSLAGVRSDRAWHWRDRYARQAPKIILRTFDGDDDDRAWDLRRAFAPKVKEALDSMIGIDSEAAWAIREALGSVWPSTAVKSLGALAGTARGAAFAERLLGEYPENISLLKHVTQIVARYPRSSEARRGAG